MCTVWDMSVLTPGVSVQRETCKLFKVSSNDIQQPVYFLYQSPCIILTTAVHDRDIHDTEKGIFKTCTVNLINEKSKPIDD